MLNYLYTFSFLKPSSIKRLYFCLLLFVILWYVDGNVYGMLIVILWYVNYKCYSVKLNSLDLHCYQLIQCSMGEGVLYNFVFTEFPFQTVSGDITAFHRIQRIKKLPLTSQFLTTKKRNSVKLNDLV